LNAECACLFRRTRAVGIDQPANYAAIDPIAVPPWVTLPEGCEVLSIALDGGPGNEASLGYVDLNLAGKSGVLASLADTLLGKGYVLQNESASPDTALSAHAMLSANDPATGKRLRIAELNTPAGPVLRIYFNDPTPEFTPLGT
jgi:hypothetical protein